VKRLIMRVVQWLSKKLGLFVSSPPRILTWDEVAEEKRQSHAHKYGWVSDLG